MKILIDLQCLQGISKKRGIGRYSLSLTQELARQAFKHEIYILLNGNFSEDINIIRNQFNDIVSEKNIKIFESLKGISGHDYLNSWKINSAEKIREAFIKNISPDLVYISSLFEGWIDDIPISIGEFQEDNLTATTLYDLIPYIYQDYYIQKQRTPYFFFQKMQYLKQSNLIITLSDSGSREAENILSIPNEKIVNCSVGLDPKFKIYDNNKLEYKEILKSKLNIFREFIFYIGGVDLRKNVNKLIEAFTLLPNRKEYQLVIILSIADSAIKHFVNLYTNQFNLSKDELILLSYVPEDLLIILYSTCSVFVFPSLHEGFGLPIIEAMACGAPTICSNLSSMPEAMGCQEGLFNPNKVEDITKKLNEVLTNKDFCNFLKRHAQEQVRKFTWNNSARKCLEALEKLYLNRVKIKTNSKNFKKKLAYLSPYPSEKTGIADYSNTLLPELACFFKITLISFQKEINDDWLNSNFEINTVDWFKKNVKEFDVILYQFGNSSHHHYMIDLLETYPGIVILHDFFLSGLYHWSEVNIPEKTNIFYRALFYSHGYAGLIYHKENNREKTLQKYPCNLYIINRAIGIIVHSDHTINLAKEWYGQNIVCKFKKILHLSKINKKLSSYDKINLKIQLGFKKDDFLICSFGFLHPNKLNHRLIQASAKLLNENKNLYLIFIGEMPTEKYHIKLLKLISKNKISSKVKFLGFTTTELYNKYLNIADMAVQLRYCSRGETSGCMLSCLSHGIPTIINAHGSLDEIPDNILIKLSDNFTDEDLQKNIYNLFKNKTLMEKFYFSSLDYIHKKHHPSDIGIQYNKAIADFYDNSYNSVEQKLIKNIAASKSENVSQTTILEVINSISANRPFFSRPQLLIDISELIERNIKYHSILFNIVSTFSLNYQIEPIYYNKLKNNFFYARKFTANLLNLSYYILEDSKIDVHENDIILSLYSDKNIGTNCQAIYRSWKNKNIKIFLFLNRETIQFFNFLIELSDICVCFNDIDRDSLIHYLDNNHLTKDAFKISNFEESDFSCFISYLEYLIQKDNSEYLIHKRKLTELNAIPSLKKEILINNKAYLIEGDLRYLGGIGPHFDQNLISIFKAFCKDDSCVLDLGANIGLTAIAFADICKQGRVIAVEPLPQSYKFLQSNFKNTNFNNVDFYNFAVGNKKTQIYMQAKSDFLAGAFIADRYQADKTHFTIQVNIDSLDNIFDKFNLKNLDFIKLDLEGYEIYALEGAKETLNKYKPIVYLEMNHWCLNVFQRISLPEFQERLIKLFPYIYAIEYPSYLDFTTVDNFYHIAHEHVTTTSKYFNLIAGFDKNEIINKLSTLI
jgi:FkbM family methyltransferase